MPKKKGKYEQTNKQHEENTSENAKNQSNQKKQTNKTQSILYHTPSFTAFTSNTVLNHD